MMSSCSSQMTCKVDLPGPSLTDVCSSSTFLVFMTLLNELINQNENISGRCERVKSIETPDGKYDYVVIGGGAGGAVVAGRLSEIADKKVLLIEAGADQPPFTEVPAFYLQALGSTIDYNYTTTNERNACLLTNGSCTWPMGKMLGGSTSHNGMKYIRGVPKDYNHWADLGNEGWTWDDVKPFFLLAEDNGEIETFGREHHSTGGPLPVKRFPYLPSFGKSILAASVEAGYGFSKDLNGDKITGFTVAQTMNKNGVRRSSAAAYLRPVMNRKNLHVFLNSTATRIIIKDRKAVGVEYYKNDVYRTVYACEEVILAAGSVRSPHILLHSGIGPKEHLESVGIRVVKDLPGVGKNLHDHVGTTIAFSVNEPDVFDNNVEVALRYLYNQTGPLSSTGLAQVMSAISSNATSPDFPDIQLYFRGYLANCAPGEVDALRSTRRRIVNVRVVYLHPRSRGTVSSASNDPLQMPVLWANFLNATNDVDRLLDGIDVAMKMADTEAMRKHNLTLANTPLEACRHHTFLTREYWACAIRYDSAPENHVVGSCKMGPASDRMAVVDPQLRVYGIKGLRVADASVMPQVTSGNTAAPTMMIGERAAHFIKTDLRRRWKKTVIHGSAPNEMS